MLFTLSFYLRNLLASPLWQVKMNRRKKWTNFILSSIKRARLHQKHKHKLELFSTTKEFIFCLTLFEDNWLHVVIMTWLIFWATRLIKVGYMQAINTTCREQQLWRETKQAKICNVTASSKKKKQGSYFCVNTIQRKVFLYLVQRIVFIAMRALLQFYNFFSTYFWNVKDACYCDQENENVQQRWIEFLEKSLGIYLFFFLIKSFFS